MKVWKQFSFKVFYRSKQKVRVKQNAGIPFLQTFIKKQDSQFSNFYWQRGYGAFSVGQLEIDVVKKYIANQKEHHKGKDFKTEYRGFLNKYDVEYDEQYVWD